MFDSIWYDTLNKPLLNPPAEIFKPAWIILYITIFLALLIYTKQKKRQVRGYVYFIIQLVLNLIWAPLFFGMHNILAAFIDIVLLNVFVILTIKEFYKASKASAIILIPYLIWILFAAYLNFSILMNN